MAHHVEIETRNDDPAHSRSRGSRYTTARSEAQASQTGHLAQKPPAHPTEQTRTLRHEPIQATPLPFPQPRSSTDGAACDCDENEQDLKIGSRGTGERNVLACRSANGRSRRTIRTGR